MKAHYTGSREVIHQLVISEARIAWSAYVSWTTAGNWLDAASQADGSPVTFRIGSTGIVHLWSVGSKFAVRFEG